MMAKKASKNSGTASGIVYRRSDAWKALVLMALPLLVLFRESFETDKILFSNDGPLGVISAEAGSLPGAFTGYWHDLNWLGSKRPSALPDFSMGLGLLLNHPVWYSKVYAPAALLFLGFSVWLFFRVLRLHPMVCLLGGLAAELNMNVFSNSCWGLPSRATTMASLFLALAAIHSGMARSLWLKLILAGCAVGHAVMEGFDVGALFSLGFGCYVFFLVATEAKPGARSWRKGLAALGVVTAAAALMATHGLSTLIGTQVKGIAGMKQDAATKEQRWNEATQWSLPVIESLRVVIPGLFGYRMADPAGNQNESCYWGGVGRDPRWSPDAPGFLVRHSGSGEYAGVVVVLVALWAAIQGLRKGTNAFDANDRRRIGFWTVFALISLVLAFGRYAPLYQVVYHLPYFSTIRNPIKFMHLFHWAVLILFGLGLQGLWRVYLAGTGSKPRALGPHLRAWWGALKGFDRKWTIGLIAAAIFGAVGWLVYAASGAEMARYLVRVTIRPELAGPMHAFSVREVGLFLCFFLLAGCWFVGVMSGWFARGSRHLVWGVLGILLVVDLARADLPWIVYYDYQQKYKSNAILDVLRQDPFQHRVTSTLNPFAQGGLVRGQGQFFPLVANTWLQHQFPYYNLQSLDVIQMPRPPLLDLSYGTNFAPRAIQQGRLYGRLWELTNTRYVLGMSVYLKVLNQYFDPVYQRFRIHTAFNLVPKENGAVRRGGRVPIGDLDARVQTNGTFALFEYGGALPRARLYREWRRLHDEEAVLRELARPEFDPQRTVLLSEDPGIPLNGVGGAAEPDTVEILDYAPKRIRLKAKTTAASLLLYNDRYHPDWAVYVDGEKRRLLRCNYIMRGVALAPGDHEILFRFEPSTASLWVSLLALVAALSIGVYLKLAKPLIRPPSART